MGKIVRQVNEIENNEIQNPTVNERVDIFTDLSFKNNDDEIDDGVFMVPSTDVEPVERK